MELALVIIVNLKNGARHSLKSVYGDFLKWKWLLQWALVVYCVNSYLENILDKS